VHPISRTCTGSKEPVITTGPVLVINSGSSSLKCGLFEPTEKAEVSAIATGSAEGVGSDRGELSLKSSDGATLYEQRHPIDNQPHALQLVAEQLKARGFAAPSAIGHRVVHGGPKLTQHQKITPQVLAELESAAHFAPLHVPVSLELIRESQRLFPQAAQVACFDTAFHRTLPEAAARFPLPEKFWETGIRRYGFHGISCESILHVLHKSIPPRLVIAHLGNGASITAVLEGFSIDTTMGLTPTGGIVMGTRPGDLDPGLLMHILQTHKDDSTHRVYELSKLLDKQSGLLGISGFTSDMRQLREACTQSRNEGERHRARLAIDIFTRTAKKAIAGYIALLGGLDLLVFTGGIGEHDSAARAEICEGLQCCNLHINGESNRRNESDIAAPQSLVAVKVLPSNEELQIARHVLRLN
jgi:acetate kinase